MLSSKNVLARASEYSWKYMDRDDFRSDDVVLYSRIEGSFLKIRLCLLLSTVLNRFFVLETSEIPPFHVSMSLGVILVQVLFRQLIVILSLHF